MSIAVRLAVASDESGIAALQGLPMRGLVKLALRTPPTPDDRVVVAERDGGLVAVGMRHRRPIRHGGESRLVGVLGGMRSSLPVLPRQATAEMYRLLRAARDPQDPEWDLTAILTGNLPARRLLEAGLPWLPRYRLVREMVTLTFRAGSAGRKSSSASPASETVVNASEANAVVVRDPGRTTTIRGYAPWLTKIRPFLDLALRLRGRPGLPPAGTTLAEAFATRTSWTPGDRTSLAGLADAIREAVSRSEHVHWGVPADHPDLDWLAGHLRAWRTSSRVYQVHDVERIPPDLQGFWPDISQL